MEEKKQLPERINEFNNNDYNQFHSNNINQTHLFSEIGNRSNNYDFNFSNFYNQNNFSALSGESETKTTFLNVLQPIVTTTTINDFRKSALKTQFEEIKVNNPSKQSFEQENNQITFKNGGISFGWTSENGLQNVLINNQISTSEIILKKPPQIPQDFKELSLMNMNQTQNINFQQPNINSIEEFNAKLTNQISNHQTNDKTISKYPILLSNNQIETLLKDFQLSKKQFDQSNKEIDLIKNQNSDNDESSFNDQSTKDSGCVNHSNSFEFNLDKQESKQQERFNNQKQEMDNLMKMRNEIKYILEQKKSQDNQIEEQNELPSTIYIKSRHDFFREQKFEKNPTVLIQQAVPSICIDPTQAITISQSSIISNLAYTFPNKKPSIVNPETIVSSNYQPKYSQQRKSGFTNTQFTCYMNSVLQCLINSPWFFDFFANSMPLDKVAFEFQKICKYFSLEEFQKSPFNTDYLKLLFCQRNQTFAGSKQQDAHEFLRDFLDVLHEDLNEIKGETPCEPFNASQNIPIPDLVSKWRKYSSSIDRSIIRDCFEGNISNSITCKFCSSNFLTFSNFLDLPLSFPLEILNQQEQTSSISLESIIRNFFVQSETIESFQCEQCSEGKSAEQKIQLTHLPKILVLHLKRFNAYSDPNGNKILSKINSKVSFPISNLDMKPFLTPEMRLKDQDYSYDLYAIVHHSGNIDEGHYTAYCKNPIDDTWNTFNDSYCNPIVRFMLDSFQIQGSETPYILFYKIKSQF